LARKDIGTFAALKVVYLYEGLSLSCVLLSLQHCDIKPDNFVLSTRQCPENDFCDIEYSDLMLVDFGRAVDLTQFSEEYDDIRKVVLRGNACRDDMKCVAMRNGKPWSFDIDTYGILCTAHLLLHGTHMSIRKGKDSQWRPEVT
jgi:checkpoint serine/threonine-protein kinase